MAKILVVDDQKALRKNLAFYLKSQGYSVDTAESAEEALDKINRTYFDMVITDYKMGAMTGYDLMKRAKKTHPSTEFIVMTAYGNIPLAVEIVRNGAADFIPKPFEYVTILEKLKKISSVKKDVPVSEQESIPQIVAVSQQMKDIVDLADKAAASNITVLIEGEHGTGKRLFAKYVHRHSDLYNNEFVSAECSNVSETNLEAEIFGIADSEDKPGALVRANGGTLFLRDVDRLTPTLQLRLLKFISEGTYFPIGSSTLKRSNARLLASTTRNLKKQVNAGNFREDLYYLLNVMPVYIPALRTRTADIAPLTRHFLEKYRAQYDKTINSISPDAMSWMNSYDWPGNVQELENILSRACALASGEVLDESLIFTLPQDRPEREEPVGYLNMTLKDNQKTLILKALKQNSNNYSRTARQLGISRTTLWRRMKKFKIEGLQIEK
jgi:two-component system NtrC family response regulator